MSRRLRRALAIPLALLIGAVVIDRIALYAWGHAVLAFYGGIHTSVNSSAALPLEKLRPPWIAVNGPGEPSDIALDLLFHGSAIRPDRVLLTSRHKLTLLFLPPRLAWTPRVFPLSLGGGGGSREPVLSYALTFVMDPATPTKPELYLRDRPIPPGTSWPSFYR